MLSALKAFEVASQWGSLVRNGDPGAVFYTFPLNDARPLNEAHRAQCLDYTRQLIAEQGEGDAADRSELEALAEFFAAAPLGDGADKRQAPNEFNLNTAGAVGAYAALADFDQGYVQALFFTSNAPQVDWEEFESEEHQDAMREGTADGVCPESAGFADLDPESVKSITADCAAFREQAADLLALAYARGYSEEQAGMDFWYTRNGHGVGYWDRQELDAESLGDKLSAVAKTFGEVNVSCENRTVYAE
jgi:hypothetical protein